MPVCSPNSRHMLVQLVSGWRRVGGDGCAGELSHDAFARQGRRGYPPTIPRQEAVPGLLTFPAFGARAPGSRWDAAPQGTVGARRRPPADFRPRPSRGLFPHVVGPKVLNRSTSNKIDQSGAGHTTESIPFSILWRGRQLMLVTVRPLFVSVRANRPMQHAVGRSFSLSAFCSVLSTPRRWCT